ncbi:DNA helicase [Tenacibaculum phage pT24]|uniref:DNA helicase n=1 Tax=Tenacibaculum phage pT24 TaxID=1880590 RepID=A0A1B4XWF7_9CAUD|nr:DNA helicase [Tenacibaculum phage pT24]BAV39135.1 DNA helicase [Tenacibaculum phage pT24]
MLKQLAKKAKAVKYSPTSSYYLDYDTNDELFIERKQRNDILINLDKNIDIDLLCEEYGHSEDISDLSLEKLLQFSEQEGERFEKSKKKYIDFITSVFKNLNASLNEFPKDNFNATYERINIHEFINDETRFERELKRVTDSKTKYEMVEEHCLTLLYTLRKDWEGLLNDDDISKKVIIEKEIEKSVLNIRNFRFAYTKNINDLYLRLLSIDTTVQNNVTILDNNQQNTEKTFIVSETSSINRKMMFDIYKSINNPLVTQIYKERFEKTKNDFINWGDNADLKEIDPVAYQAKLDKTLKGLKSRLIPVAYSTYTGIRPSEDYGDYEHWNGLQAFDLDIKFCADEIKDPKSNKVIGYENQMFDEEDVAKMKVKLHKALSKYNWYLCAKTSISEKGLHVITKVKPMHHIFKDDSDNKNINKFWFMMNYYHKYTIIKWILLNELGIPEKHINKVIDSSMAKISQGIVLNTDLTATWNDTYMELPLTYGLHIPPKEGMELDEWILEPNNLKRMLTSVSMKALGNETLDDARSRRRKNSSQHTFKVERVDNVVKYDFKVGNLPSISEIKPIDYANIDKGQRDFIRHKAMRTIVALYDGSENTRKLVRHYLKVDVYGKDTWGDEKEFHGKWNYAVKKPTVFNNVLPFLNKAGFKIELDDSKIEEIKNSKMGASIEGLKNSTVSLKEIIPHYSFRLPKATPYLGQIGNQIVDSLTYSKINVIEAAPGTGKTTLFNKLAKKYRICLVCPYQSVLKNKVEGDIDASQYFDTFYGGKKIDFSKLGNKSVATTFDTFNTLTEEDYKKFDIIAIDESHLLFTEGFRGKTSSALVRGVDRFVIDEVLKRDLDFDSNTLYNSNYFIDNEPLLNKLENANKTKVVLMTGTITGELLYFSSKDRLNYIKINSDHKYGKHANFYLCETSKSLKETMAIKMAQSLDEGKTLLVPTNNGDTYINALVEQLKYLTKTEFTDENWGYYSKKTNNDEMCKMINDKSLVPEKIKLIFCTRYLGVGVDIINERKFEVFINGDETTAQDIEQYNNRIRRAFIECSIFYCALEENSSGVVEIKPKIFSTPNEISLRDKNNYQKEISDDKRVATANRNISRNDEKARYKLQEVLTHNEAYHINTAEGVEFNEESFLIKSFAKDFEQIATSACYTKYMLQTYYNYTVGYNFTVLDDEDVTKRLGIISKESSKETELKRTKAYEDVIDFCVENKDKILDSKIDYQLYDEREFRIDIIPLKKGKENPLGFDYEIKYSSLYEKQFKEAYTRMKKLLRVYTPEVASEFLKKRISSNGKVKKAETKRDMALFGFLKRLIYDDKLLVANYDIFKIVEEFLNDGMNDIQYIDEHNFIFNEFAVSGIINKINNYGNSFISKLGDGLSFQSNKKITEIYENAKETLKTLFEMRKVKGSEDFKLTRRMIPPIKKDNSNGFLGNEELEKFLMGDTYTNKEYNEDEIDLDEVTNRKGEDMSKTISNNKSGSFSDFQYDII